MDYEATAFSLKAFLGPGRRDARSLQGRFRGVQDRAKTRCSARQSPRKGGGGFNRSRAFRRAVLKVLLGHGGLGPFSGACRTCLYRLFCLFVVDLSGLAWWFSRSSLGRVVGGTQDPLDAIFGSKVGPRNAFWEQKGPHKVPWIPPRRLGEAPGSHWVPRGDAGEVLGGLWEAQSSPQGTLGSPQGSQGGPS